MSCEGFRPIEFDRVIATRSGPKPARCRDLALLRVARGHAVWTIDRQRWRVRPDDVLWLWPGQVFSGIDASDEVPVEVERLRLRPGPAMESEARLPGGGPGRAAGPGGVRVGELATLLGVTARTVRPVMAELTRQDRRPVLSLGREGARAMEGIRELLEAGGELAAIGVRAAAWHLLARLATGCREPVAGGSASAADAASGERRVREWLRRLEETCDEPWTLEAMAAEAGLKRSRFGTLCRRITGDSPLVHLSRLRIRRSRRLLAETGRSVTEIAFDCGFGSSQYFAKVFRRYQGHEPTHYRQLALAMRRSGGIQYLKSDSARVKALARRAVGGGDFTVEGRLTLDRLGGTAASLELGPDRFGFDGRDGRLFLEGHTFGEARFFDRSDDHIREGMPFEFSATRRGDRLAFVINGREVTAVPDQAGRRIGRVGLRPLRNGIHIARFAIDGESVALLGGEAE